jgi:hypothetical protein
MKINTEVRYKLNVSKIVEENTILHTARDGKTVDKAGLDEDDKQRARLFAHTPSLLV